MYLSYVILSSVPTLSDYSTIGAYSVIHNMGFKSNCD